MIQLKNLSLTLQILRQRSETLTQNLNQRSLKKVLQRFKNLQGIRRNKKTYRKKESKFLLRLKIDSTTWRLRSSLTMKWTKLEQRFEG